MTQESFFNRRSKAEVDRYWADVWFRLMQKFHSQAGSDPDWDFTPEDVTSFLRSKRDQGAPDWKRMKILEGILHYRQSVQNRSIEPFIWISDKMRQIVLLERAKKEGFDTIEESVGRIDPQEPDAIQEFRRQGWRRFGYRTHWRRSIHRRIANFAGSTSLPLHDCRVIRGPSVFTVTTFIKTPLPSTCVLP